METSTKIILPAAMYGLPVCFAIIYRIREDLKMKYKGKVETTGIKNTF
jgi:hypothetical protein